MADGLEFAVLGPVTVRRDGNPIALDTQRVHCSPRFSSPSRTRSTSNGCVRRCGTPGQRRPATGRSREAPIRSSGCWRGCSSGSRPVLRRGSGSWSATGHGCSCSSTRMRWILGVSSPRCAAGTRWWRPRRTPPPTPTARGCGCGGASPMRGSADGLLRNGVHRNRSVPADHPQIRGAHVPGHGATRRRGAGRGRCGGRSARRGPPARRARVGSAGARSGPVGTARACTGRAPQVPRDHRRPAGLRDRSRPPAHRDRDPRERRRVPRIRPGVRAAEVSRIEPDGAADPPHRP